MSEHSHSAENLNDVSQWVYRLYRLLLTNNAWWIIQAMSIAAVMERRCEWVRIVYVRFGWLVGRFGRSVGRSARLVCVFWCNGVLYVIWTALRTHQKRFIKLRQRKLYVNGKSFFSPVVVHVTKWGSGKYARVYVYGKSNESVWKHCGDLFNSLCLSPADTQSDTLSITQSPLCVSPYHSRNNVYFICVPVRFFFRFVFDPNCIDSLTTTLLRSPIRFVIGARYVEKEKTKKKILNETESGK